MTTLATRLQDGTAQSLRSTAISPSSWREEDRSFEVVWSTGAAVTRFDWWDGEFYDETLDLSEGAVNLARLQAGGPVLIDHVTSTDRLAGSIIPGSVRVERGNAIARVRLAQVPELDSLAAKIRDGHLRTVSVGYLVHEYTRYPGGKGERDELRATNWEPTEISLTPVPADAGAIVRSRSNETMTTKTTIRDADDSPEDPRAERGSKPSRRRTVDEADILRACSRAGVSRDVERKLLEAHERDPMTKDELLETMLDEVGKRRNSAPINANRHPGAGAASREAFADALYARLSGTEPTDAARPFIGASITDMARALLEEAGEQVRWSRPTAVVDMIGRAGQHTTGDFAWMIDSATNRFLLNTFSTTGSPLRQLARPRTLPDFKAAHGYAVEGPSGLRLVRESGEFKRSTLTETKDSIKLETYGEILSISRQAIVNDDLGAFAQVATFFARAAAETEASYLAAMINGTGATVRDGEPLYDATHGNLAGSGGAIDETTLSAARAAMRNQKNHDGESFANVTPRYLVVAPARETEAEKILASINPATSSNANPFAGALELIVDPRLTGTGWRLFADPMQHPVLEIARLDGQEGVFTDTRVGFDVDGVEVKARIDLGVAAWDWRGTYLNPGN